MPRHNPNNDRTQISTTLKSSLLTYARLKAASEGVTLNSVLEEALLRLYNTEPLSSTKLADDIKEKINRTQANI
jgi:hypothetical protein